MPSPEDLLSTLMKRAFAMAKESVPLGFDVARIEPTLKKLPGGSTTGLEALFVSLWPAESFHTGTVEMFGPDRINQEHDDLMPGCVAIRNGFLGIGGNGGNLFSYCIADGPCTSWKATTSAKMQCTRARGSDWIFRPRTSRRPRRPNRGIRLRRFSIGRFPNLQSWKPA